MTPLPFSAPPSLFNVVSIAFIDPATETQPTAHRHHHANVIG
jgi:hypothetical protein